MIKALELTPNYYLNMDSIVTWQVTGSSISIETNNPDRNIEIEIYNADKNYYNTPYIAVRPDELCRIEDEIKMYMGLTRNSNISRLHCELTTDDT